MERLIDVNLCHILDENTVRPYVKFQHACKKERSVQTTSTYLAGRTEKSLAQKKYMLATFLDIEEAFNVTIWSSNKITDHYG